jgi:uncharacterized protein (TIGR02246 family)
MLKIVVWCLAFMVPGALFGQPGPQTDVQAIRTVMDGFMDAWNRHDAKAWAALFSEDSDFTNVRGIGASGRSNIEQFHARVFATIFKSSVQKYTDIKTRFVRPDVAAVDVRWEMTGSTDPAGNPVPLRTGLLSFVMVKSQGNWQIMVMHNQDLTAPPPVQK